MLKSVLVIFALVSLVYGLGYLLIPAAFVSLSGSAPIDIGWIRWSGGPLLGLGIGAVLVRRNLKGQAPFVTALTWGTFLTGLGLLYTWLVGETPVQTWYIAVPTIITLCLAVLLQWSGQKAKGLLKAG
jgi:peptidoglycan/LPS O-acetylase OafA/YrhL